MSLVGGADLNGAASGDPTDLRFDRSYRASPTRLKRSRFCSAMMLMDHDCARIAHRSATLAMVYTQQWR
eukprot:6183102-Pleurochrysis_carterae.AAC.1